MPRNGCRHVPYNPGTKPYNGQRNGQRAVPPNAVQRSTAVRYNAVPCTCRNRANTVYMPAQPRAPHGLPAGRHDPACAVPVSSFVGPLSLEGLFPSPARSPRKRSAPVCAASPLPNRPKTRMSSRRKWRSYRFTLRRRIYHGTVIVTTYTETKLQTPIKPAARIGTAQLSGHAAVATKTLPPVTASSVVCPLS